ncbi:MAG: hypothetical protein HGB05_06045 [Chloroflexi bacterium]|nr:hypothetical protein [Chloroflexota bacterium]
MDSFPYPMLEFDPSREALIEPRDVLEHRVICFFNEVIEKVVTEQH